MASIGTLWASVWPVETCDWAEWEQRVAQVETVFQQRLWNHKQLNSISITTVLTSADLPWIKIYSVWMHGLRPEINWAEKHFHKFKHTKNVFVTECKSVHAKFSTCV